MSRQQDRGTDEVDVVLSEERLQHTVVRVPRERVRISKRITTEVRTIEVPVRVEHLVIEREPVGDAVAGDGTAGADGEGRVPEELVLVLHEEVPTVTLQVQPTERISVRVQRVTEHRTVSEVLRHEEADLEFQEGTSRPTAGRGGPAPGSG